MFTYATNIYPFDDADEWRYTACSRLVAHGYPLFTQVFSAQPPLLFASLAGSMRIFGESIQGARGIEIVFGLVSLAAVCWLAWLLAGPWGCAVSAVALAVSPGFLVYSHMVEAEGPMMALATLSLALALANRKGGGSAMALLAGLALASAVLMKLFAVEAALPAAWLIVANSRPRLDRGKALLLFVAGLVVPIVLEFSLISPGPQWDQVVLLHRAAGRLSFAGNPSPVHIMREFFALDLGLSLLALAGAITLALCRRWVDLIFFLLWIGGSLLMLLLFRPLFPHHAAILLASLAVLAGVGGGIAFSAIRSRMWVRVIPFAVAGLLYLVTVPRLAHADRHTLIGGTRPGVVPLATFVDQHSGQADFVAVDDLAVADTANRLVPPPLCDPSIVRLRSGYLTRLDAIDATSRYHARLVVPSFGIYGQVPGYLPWVRRHYRAVHGPDGTLIYTDLTGR